MYYALDKNNDKINIDESTSEHSYICPICNGALIRKCGKIKAHHFAHKQNVCDSWYHENKGEWHKNMQSHFKPENCEVRIDSDTEEGVFHIADVFLEDMNNNIIIEFQHSAISIEDFDKRNAFYSRNRTKTDENGKKVLNTVIWVFDCHDKRMFIDVMSRRNIHRSGNYTESTCNNQECIDFFHSATNIDKNIPENAITQKDVYPDASMFAHINWKRPSKIFRNTPSNVYIFFDVCQKRYIRGTNYRDYNGNTYENEYIHYLNEVAENPNFDNNMHEFLVFCSYEYPEALERMKEDRWLINSSLKGSCSYLTGRCIPYDIFYEFYGEFGMIERDKIRAFAYKSVYIPLQQPISLMDMIA